MTHPAKIVLLVTLLVVGALAMFADGLGLLGLGLMAALLLTAKHRSRI